MFFHVLSFGAGHKTRKVDGPFVIARGVWTVDVAEFALKAEIDDDLHIFWFQFFRVNGGVLVFCAVTINSIKKFRKTAAKFVAQTAVGA